MTGREPSVEGGISGGVNPPACNIFTIHAISCKIST